MGEADPLLSSLCAICHVNPHVYKCPRCSVLTCSLACVKRHKKWAQCNGVRNPAAYVPINELATPAGIDKDYNYLTSLERQLDNAEQDASSRGVQLADEILDKAKLKKGAQGLQTALERSRAIIIRAPKGMSREKTNMTRWFKGSQRLEWTVEWVHDDGKKELGQCVETEPIYKVYEALKETRQRKKRKHAVNQVEQVQQAKKQLQNQIRSAKKENDEAAGRVIGSDNVPMNDFDTLPQVLDNQAQRRSTSASSSTLSLFLHAPALPTKKIVLIPLDHAATLRTLLRERVVLEYPTIHAFHHDPIGSLPEQFMLEDEYLKVARQDKIQELEDGEIEEESSNNLPDQSASVGRVDEKKLLEVLGRDLGRSI